MKIFKITNNITLIKKRRKIDFKESFFLYIMRNGGFFMEEKITATIRNENDEREEVEIIVDDIELSPEMEEELSNGNGGEE